jgi:KAP family P-loop domain/TIR domain
MTVAETGDARVLISYAQDDQSHVEMVRRLRDLLRDCGIDAHLHPMTAERTRDWPAETQEQVEQSDFVLVIASPEYKRRAEGAEAGEGRDVQWEAALLRQVARADQQGGLAKMVAVILPGRSPVELPAWFGSTRIKYIVSDFSAPGAEELLRHLSGHPNEPNRDRGSPRNASAAILSSDPALEEAGSRQQEVDELVAFFRGRSPGLGTAAQIVGPAGLGKTSVAAAVGARLHGDFGSGIRTLQHSAWIDSRPHEVSDVLIIVQGADPDDLAVAERWLEAGASLLVTTRDPIQGFPGVTITLDPLTAAEARKFLDSLAPGLPDEVAATIVTATSGIPLALRLAAAQAIAGDQPSLDPSGGATVSDLLIHQYASLDQQARRLLRLISLLDRDEAIDVLVAARLLGVELSAARSAIAALSTAGLLAEGTDGIYPPLHVAIHDFASSCLIEEDPEELDQALFRLRRWRFRQLGIPPKPVLTRDYWTTQDALGYGPYADALASFIRHPDTRPPLTIGIKGPWGAGKTSLMRMIQQELDPADDNSERRKITLVIRRPAKRLRHRLRSSREEDVVSNHDVVLEAKRLAEPAAEEPGLRGIPARGDQPADDWRPTVWFNPWMYQSGEQIWAGLAYEVIEQITGRLPAVDRERFWLQLNLARLDRQAVRRRAYRLLVDRLLPIALAFAGISLVAVGTLALAMVAQDWRDTLYRIAAGVLSFGSAGVVAAGIRRTTTFWRESAAASFGRMVRGSLVLNSTLGQPTKDMFDEVSRDPGYGTRIGLLHLAQADMKRVLNLVATPDRPLVIFVDDLDRCAPGPAVQVIEAVNLFLAGEFPNCIFLLAMEPSIVAAHVEVAYKDLTSRIPAANERAGGTLGWRFLEKIVQLPIAIPTDQDRGQLDSYVKTLLGVPADTVTHSHLSNPSSERASTASPLSVPAGPADTERSRAGDVGVSSSESADREHSRTVALLEATIRSRGPTLRTLAGIAREAQQEILGDSDRLERTTIAAVDRIFPELYSDVDEYSYIEQGLPPLGSANPREVKRYINLYRFFTFVSYRRQLAGGTHAAGEQIAKLAALAIRWPHLLDAFGQMTDDGRTVLETLEGAAPDGQGSDATASAWNTAMKAIDTSLRPDTERPAWEQLRGFLATEPNIGSIARGLL